MKTLLIDDHALFREGLALLMSSAFPEHVCHQAGSLAQALDLLAAQPDIRLVLFDLGLPDNTGIAGLQRLREAAPQASVVVLSADDTPETVLAAIDNGAAGFIPKTSRPNAMREALERVLAGGVYLPPDMLGPRPDAAHADGTALGMSPRQLDVLRLLIDGKSNKLICRELDLAESTVKTHLAAIFRKLEVSSRTQAVVAAARLGLRLGDAYGA